MKVTNLRTALIITVAFTPDEARHVQGCFYSAARDLPEAAPGTIGDGKSDPIGSLRESLRNSAAEFGKLAALLETGEDVKMTFHDVRELGTAAMVCEVVAKAQPDNALAASVHQYFSGLNHSCSNLLYTGDAPKEVVSLMHREIVTEVTPEMVEAARNSPTGAVAVFEDGTTAVFDPEAGAYPPDGSVVVQYRPAPEAAPEAPEAADAT